MINGLKNKWSRASGGKRKEDDMRVSRVLVLLSVGLAAAFVILGVTSVAMAAQPQTPQPAVSLTATALQISPPEASFARAILTVAGPNGFHYRKVVRAGEPIALDTMKLADENGNAINLVNGRYTWELRVITGASGTMSSPQAQRVERAGVVNDQRPSQVMTYTGELALTDGTMSVVPRSRADEGERPATASSAVSSRDGDQAPPAGGEPDASVASVMTPAAPTAYSATNWYVSNYLSVGTDSPSFHIQYNDSLPVIGIFDTAVSGFHWNIDAWNNEFYLFDSSTNNHPFSIDTGAPYSAIKVLSSGYVGFGTSAPATELHVIGDGGNAILRLEGSGGDYGQWFAGSSYTGFGLQKSGGSYTEPFRVDYGAPTNSLRITSNGYIGIGTGTPAAKLHVFTPDTGGNVAIVRGGALQVSREDGNSANIRFSASGKNWLFQNNPANATFGIRDETAGNSPLLIYGAGQAETVVIRGGKVGLKVGNPSQPLQLASGAYCSAGGVWTNASSRAFKRDITELPADEALKVCEDLKPVTFEYKANPEKKHVGFIAEDVPDLVATQDRKGLAAMDIVGVLTKVVQQQQEALQNQQKTITNLQHRLANLESHSR